jgi:hypothetical protein
MDRFGKPNFLIDGWGWQDLMIQGRIVDLKNGKKMF